jgi:hypothetical protein
LLVASGCSGGGDSSEDTSSADSSASTTISLPESHPPTTVEDGQYMVAQAIESQIKVWDKPGKPDDFVTKLKASDETSGIVTFLVEERRDDGWLKVELPTAPAGTSGFVLERDVVLTRHRYRIEISRRAHKLVVFAGGVEAFDEKVAIGPDTPPAGTDTYIKEVLLPPAGSVYDPQAYTYGLAGAANSKQEFADGSGVVAIHAVADPATLGADSPTGSIGMDPAVLKRLYENVGLPLGTPVAIKD